MAHEPNRATRRRRWHKWYGEFDRKKKLANACRGKSLSANKK